MSCQRDYLAVAGGIDGQQVFPIPRQVEVVGISVVERREHLVHGRARHVVPHLATTPAAEDRTLNIVGTVDLREGVRLTRLQGGGYAEQQRHAQRRPDQTAASII
jgi:hypothetical protein